jgi:hypothetical protein
MRTPTAYRLVFGMFAVLLVVAVPFAIAGSGEDRRNALGLVVAAATIGGFWWLDREFRQEPRRRAAEAAGWSLGLRPSSDDGWLRAIGFDFLRPRGTVQDVSNALEGMWRGEPAAAFEYRWATEDAEHRYSCALLPVPAAWPRLTIERETPLSRVAQVAGVADVETEWEEFNRAYRVGAADARFATALLDGAMMEWLVARPESEGFEISGGWLLAFATQVYPWEIEQVLENALAFRDRIPAVVRSLFGDLAATPRRPDEGTSSA